MRPPSALLLAAPVFLSAFAARAQEPAAGPPARSHPLQLRAAGDAGERVGTAGLGLGRALARRGPVRRDGDTRLITPGGIGLRLQPDGLQLEIPDAPGLRLDAEGRFHAGAKALTAAAPHGLCVRFADGSELRYEPGRGQLLQRIELVDAGVAHTMLVRGRLRPGTSRPAPFPAPRYYVADEGRSLVQLSLFGPWLLIRPILVHSGADKNDRLVFCADLWRAASFALAETMPARSAQYPLSRQQVAAVAEATARLFPAERAREDEFVARVGEPLVLPLGDELRVSLERIPGNLDFVTRLRVHPDAPETIEVLHAWRNETMHRVLPPERQSRGRVVGNGLDFDAFVEKRLPWPRPLDGAAQRREARKWIQSLLPPPNAGK